MSESRANLILRHIRRLAVPAGEDCSDRDLLQRFTDRRDEAAFDCLMRRHRPMVQGVALRLLGDRQDAEDVVQATFLVLARRAKSLRWQESAASWLYRVGYHLALKLRTANHRRRTHERQAAGHRTNNPLDDMGLREAQAVIDEELAALAERYRAPVLLCCLEGATRDEAARQLGWSLATLKRRLTKGRELLRARLRRRGFTLAAVLAPGLFAPERSASAAIGPPSAQAVSLAEGALRTMSMLKLKLTAALVLAAGVLSIGSGFSMWQGRSEAPPTPAAQQPNLTEAPSQLRDRYGDALPADARARLGTVRLRHGNHIQGIDLSPDGRMLATSGGHGYVRLWDLDTGEELRSLHREDPWTTSHMVAFSPDGRTLVSGSMDTTALLWDLRGRRPPRPLADLEILWRNLADADAARAYQAMLALAAVPEQATSLLRERVPAAQAPDPRRLKQLLADLDSERFEIRENAARQLASIGDLARPALQQALQGKPSLEVRRRVEQLLRDMEPANSPETLRALRAIEVLENIGTAEARRTVETLARGAAESRRTREAKAALARLTRR